MLWLLWIAITASLGLYAVLVIVYGGNRAFLLMGRTTSGHHQIELACDACHTSVFGGAEVLQDACVTCHGAELKAANDTHPKSKFTDPRNADRTELLDARYCVTCHQEHRPGITQAMGVTLPRDYCFICHHDVADDRPSHKGLAFTTCASAGCHRFHDNRALYQDFLVKHAGEPSQLDAQRVALVEWLKEKEGAVTVAKPLAAGDADAPAARRVDRQDRGGLGRRPPCAGGRQLLGLPHRAGRTGALDRGAELAECKTCHASQATTFTEGKHGMRRRDGLVATRDGPFGLFKQSALPPMTPAQARLPMKADAHGRNSAAIPVIPRIATIVLQPRSRPAPVVMTISTPRHISSRRITICSSRNWQVGCRPAAAFPAPRATCRRR